MNRLGLDFASSGQRQRSQWDQIWSKNTSGGMSYKPFVAIYQICNLCAFGEKWNWWYIEINIMVRVKVSGKDVEKQPCT